MMITIAVNGKSLEIDNGFNILQLLKETESPKDGIAVAINNSIITKNLWESTILSQNDSVLIIQATQGG